MEEFSEGFQWFVCVWVIVKFWIVGDYDNKGIVRMWKEGRK